VAPRYRQGVSVEPIVRRRGSSVVDWAFYREGKRQVEPDLLSDAISRARAGDGFVWIGLYEPGAAELGRVAAEFGLHPLAVEDALHAHQRPKLEHFDDSLFVVLKTVSYVDHDELTATSEIIETGEVMVFLGDCFVVTVRHGAHGSLTALRERLEKDPEGLLAHGPSAALWGIADQVVDDYMAVAELVEDDIDEIEASVFARTRTRDTGRIYQLKREVMELRRAISPLGGPMRTLVERPHRLIHPEAREYFRDVEDHLKRVVDQVLGFDELLGSILQASTAQLTLAQNEDMRRISAWVAIIAVPTMIAGIYGMNFVYMPELQQRYGYPVVLAVIATACLFLYRGFKRNGWL